MATVKVNENNIWYETYGSGPPLVLIHGLGSSGLDWEYQISAFSQDYSVITIDVRGHGQSERATGNYSMSLFAQDVAGVLDHLAVKAAHVVGISMGGGIAFQLAVDRPDLFKSMVIVNSGPHAVFDSLKQKLVIWSRLAIIRLLGLPTLAIMVAGKLFPDPEQAALRSTFIERFKQNDKASYIRSLKALVGWSVMNRLGEISVPTLVIAADQDYTPIEMKQAYVALMPNAKLVVIPNSHHGLPIERPAEFNQALRAFLQSIEGK